VLLPVTPSVPLGADVVVSEDVVPPLVELLGAVAFGAGVGETPAAQDALVGTATLTVSQSWTAKLIVARKEGVSM
jgi:hypothetical protein